MTKPGETDDDLLTPDEVFELLRITQKTLCERSNIHRKRQLLAPFRFSTKGMRYERRNLKAFIDKYRPKY